LQVSIGDRVTTHFRTRKTGELLGYLAYFRERVHPREVLIDLLWPEDDIYAGRHSLSTALSSLRAVLGAQEADGPSAIILADRHTVGLDPSAVSTDVAAFEEAIRSASHDASPAGREAKLSAALSMRRGEFLSGYYGDWIFPEQQRLEELYFQAARQRIALLEAAGDNDGALQVALQTVAASRLREETHREVIRLYEAAGRPESALRRYAELKAILDWDSDASAIPGSGSPREVPVHSPKPLPPSIGLIRSPQLEPVGGAVPLDSRFYVVRPTDKEFHAAIAARESTVLVKGSRQAGKSSLLARGLQRGREEGYHVVLTNFQTLTAGDLGSPERFFVALAESLADQLDSEVVRTIVWDDRRGPTSNFRRYLSREVLGASSAPLVWGLDEVDRLFGCPFASDVFGLFRSWHDGRALDPDGPWGRLTLAMAYSTEAHLFITDANQSPFNLGTRISLEDFTVEQVADLDCRYGSPLKSADNVKSYFEIVAGQPFLVRRGLHEMATRATSLSEFGARAASDDWILGEHLRRIVTLVGKDAELTAGVRSVMEGSGCRSLATFYRLRAAGILAGDSEERPRFRCPLYAAYLSRHLL
jgi:DNA-binding SARP family transcriptional activator